MKKSVLVTALALTLALVIDNGSGSAQMMGGGPGTMQGEEQPQSSQTTQQGYPYMAYPGMMGGYGMGPGMMGGYGMGPGMMGGYGYGMGPGMMGGCGYGMGPGMMGGYGYGPAPGQPGYVDPEKYQKFLDETKDLRKKMHDLRFEYGEMARNPKTTMEDRNKMEKEIFDLQQKIQEKAVK